MLSYERQALFAPPNDRRPYDCRADRLSGTACRGHGGDYGRSDQGRSLITELIDLPRRDEVSCAERPAR